MLQTYSVSYCSCSLLPGTSAKVLRASSHGLCYSVAPFLSESNSGGSMLKSELLAAIQREIHSHDFSHFVDEPPSIADGAEGTVI